MIVIGEQVWNQCRSLAFLLYRATPEDTDMKALASLALPLTFSLLVAGCGGDGDSGGVIESARTIYTMTNDTGTNRIAIFGLKNGALTSRGFVASGGAGSGPHPLPGTPGVGSDPLSSQGSLTMSEDRRTLFAVNAAGASISSFRIANDGGLTLLSTVSSGGTNPVSFSVSRGRGYAVNVNDAGATTAATISGFNVASNGTLTAIANSTRPLSAINARPSQVSVHGAFAIVTERGTDKITAFPILAGGTLGTPVVTASVAPGPFGFDFHGDLAVVSEVHPGTMGTGTATTYRLGAGGGMTPISSAVANSQSGSCWATISPNGRFAYVANTGSDNVTTYAVAASGTMTLLQGSASTTVTGSGVVDGDVSSDGGEFVELYSNKGQIGVFNVRADGTLLLSSNLPAGLLPPVGAQGLVVR